MTLQPPELAAQEANRQRLHEATAKLRTMEALAPKGLISIPS